MTNSETTGVREMLLVSDFDQTLSFNDSGTGEWTCRKQ
jgi:hypothetical protein